MLRTTQRAPMDGLMFKNWQEWRKETHLGSHASDVDGWIGQLNNALAQIGRPFAFRLDRAMHG